MKSHSQTPLHNQYHKNREGGSKDDQKLTNPKISCPRLNSREFFSPSHWGCVAARPSSISTALPPVTNSALPCVCGSAVTWMMYRATSAGVFSGIFFSVHMSTTPDRSCVSVAHGPVGNGERTGLVNVKRRGGYLRMSIGWDVQIAFVRKPYNGAIKGRSARMRPITPCFADE